MVVMESVDGNIIQHSKLREKCKHSANTACGKADLRILLIPGASNLIR